MLSAVCFTNCRLSKFDVLQTDGDVVVNNVKFDVTAFIIDNFFIGSNTNVANDFFHTGNGIVSRRDTVVVGCELVVDEATFFEK